MALNAGECDAMIAACRAAGVPLFVAYYRRALPRFLKVKELIDTGAIGDVRAVTITLYRQYEPPPRRRRGQPRVSRQRRCRGGSIRRFRAAGCSSISRRIRSICSTSSSGRSRA